jgi:PrtD family type I secretion system ABC transporter
MKWLFARSLRRFVFMAAGASLLLNVMALAPSLFMLQVFDRVFSSGSMETLTMLTLLVLVCLVIMSGMDILRARILGWASTVLDQKLGPEVLLSLLGNSASVGGARNVHTLRDVGMLRGFLAGGGIFALFDAPWLPLYLLLIFAFHPVMGLTALIGALLLFGIIMINERLTRSYIEASTQKTRNASRFIDAALRNAEVVAGMGMAPRVVGRWSELNDELLEQQMRLTRIQSMLQAGVRLVRQGIQVAMLVVGAWLVVRQHASPGIMVAATILQGKALQPIEQLVTGWRNLIEARAAWARLCAEPLRAKTNGLELPAPQGKIDLERVMFVPGPKQPAIIKGISLSLPAGECLGLIGPSGSGKTSLLRLILGIWTPQSGAVRLDGADIGSYSREQIGRHVGYLPQDVELFAGTVAANIARLQEPDPAAVIAAAQLAGVHELILRLPGGYDTPIGDAGASLSGGQRQRIALARALYGQPRLLVLDEPNSNLDVDGENALQEALRRVRELGITVVLVGHRPSMMRSVDRLAVLRDGALELYGPRDQVLAKLSGGGTAAAVALPVHAA